MKYITNIMGLILIISLLSCSSSQIFFEARTTYDLPVSQNGLISTETIQSDFENINAKGIGAFQPQVRLTYRQYLFDGKKRMGTKALKEFIEELNKIKPVNNFQQGGFSAAPKSDKVQHYIVKQSSLKCATDFVIANGGDEARVIERADMFTTWVLEDKKPTTAPQEMPF